MPAFSPSLRLLIIAQRIDRRDPILGFFHRWVEGLAERCASVTAVGQAVGEHAFPANVSVLSLGKETGVSRARQILRFWALLWALRRRYDAVFVHMSPVWVVLGYPLLWMLQKPAYQWYEVRRGGLVLRLAVWFARKTFSATQYGLPFRSRRNVVTGHGIDTDRFVPPKNPRDERLLCAVGRITRIKRIELFLRTLADLPPSCRLFLAGGTITADDERYRRALELDMRDLRLEDRVEMRWVDPQELPALLQRCSLFLHAGGGGLDKVLLEAMACGCPVLSSSSAASALLPAQCRATPETFPSAAAALFRLPPEERDKLSRRLRETVVASHGLPTLLDRLVAEMEKRS